MGRIPRTYYVLYSNALIHIATASRVLHLILSYGITLCTFEIVGKKRVTMLVRAPLPFVKSTIKI